MWLSGASSSTRILHRRPLLRRSAAFRQPTKAHSHRLRSTDDGVGSACPDLSCTQTTPVHLLWFDWRLCVTEQSRGGDRARLHPRSGASCGVPCQSPCHHCPGAARVEAPQAPLSVCACPLQRKSWGCIIARGRSLPRGSQVRPRGPPCAWLCRAAEECRMPQSASASRGSLSRRFVAVLQPRCPPAQHRVPVRRCQTCSWQPVVANDPSLRDEPGSRTFIGKSNVTPHTGSSEPFERRGQSVTPLLSTTSPVHTPHTPKPSAWRIRATSAGLDANPMAGVQHTLAPQVLGLSEWAEPAQTGT